MSLCGGDAPDTSKMQEAAQYSAETGRRALDWFTKEYEKTAPERQRAADEAVQLSQAQRGLMDTQTALAKDYADYNRTTFRPLEQRLVTEAQTYDTPERRAQAAREAVTDVETQAGRQRQARMAEMASFGIAPDSAKSMAIAGSDSINNARIAAGAASGARKQVEATGYARMADAANMGRGLPSAQATAVQTASNAGNAALGASNSSLQSTMSGAPLMQTGFNTGLQGNQIAGNLYGQQAQIQNQGDSGLGSLLGGVGGIMYGMGSMGGWSSKKLKTDKRDVDEDEALEAVNATPVQATEYKPGVATMTGRPEGQTHVGPYAEDVQQAQGNEAAPGGKVVNFARMAQTNAKAIQALSKQLEQIEEAVERLAA